MKIVGIVPAKGSSSRVPSKNLQRIGGIPLFLRAAAHLSQVLPCKDIYIDSDDTDILAMARRYGFSCIQRDKKLATNATNGNQLLAWEISQVSADIYVQHLPPMPFCCKKTLLKGLELISLDYVDSVFAGYKTQIYQWNTEGPMYNVANLPNSFNLPEIIIESMGLYFTKYASFKEYNCRVAGNWQLLELDPWERIDIDYPEDLLYAQSISAGLVESDPHRCMIPSFKYMDGVKAFIFDIDSMVANKLQLTSTISSDIKKSLIQARDKGINIIVPSLNGNMYAFLEPLNQDIYCQHNGDDKFELLANILSVNHILPYETAYFGADISNLQFIQGLGFSITHSTTATNIQKCFTLSLPDFNIENYLW